MSLKDDMQRDFGDFFNSEEFAELHVVAGKKIQSVLYELTSQERGIHGEQPQSWQMQARKQDLPSILRAGDTLTIDGKVWIINGFKDDMGVAVITLTRRG